MKIFPVLLDSRPKYLEFPAAEQHSLLLMPLGAETLLDHLRQRVARCTSYAPAILTAFEPSTAYEAALRKAGVTQGKVFSARRFEDRLAMYEPSDWLLLVDPSRFPAGGFDFSRVAGRAHRRVTTHLVVADRSRTGTKEYVQCDADGRVRRIQRYYDTVNWPFATEVTATLLPIACTALLKIPTFESLAQLRHSLALLGVPGRDVVLPGKTFDLRDERGFLGLSERFTLDRYREGDPDAPAADLVGEDPRDVHPSVRFVGPVVVHGGAVIEEAATIIGPALVGAGASVGRGAVVAQCIVGPGAIVPAQAQIRHRIWFGDDLGLQPDRRRGRSEGPVASGEFESRRDSAPIDLARPTSSPSLAYLRIKLGLDVLIAAAALALLSPLLLLIALLIKLTSDGPVLYGDPREGREARVFRCWKFRTMRAGTDTLQRELYTQNSLDGPQFKLKDDPRVTPLGRWLRRTNLDEVPQLLNVVYGQMSLVGPRPSPFRENQICVPWREARLSVRPGITGLWQLCREDRASGDFHQWISYDVRYVRHMSLATDLKILVATVLTLGGRWRVPSSWLVPDERDDE